MKRSRFRESFELKSIFGWRSFFSGEELLLLAVLESCIDSTWQRAQNCPLASQSWSCWPIHRTRTRSPEPTQLWRSWSHTWQSSLVKRKEASLQHSAKHSKMERGKSIGILGAEGFGYKTSDGGKCFQPLELHVGCGFYVLLWISANNAQTPEKPSFLFWVCFLLNQSHHQTNQTAQCLIEKGLIKQLSRGIVQVSQL